ncbi:MAG TPA: hypothetical protein VLV28_06510 [Gaiellaceae bacterium]|nr:hypothetical protein [Gaiellaceae bacterium]
MYRGGPFYADHVHHGHPVIWVALFLLFVALLVLALVALVRHLRGPGAPPAAVVAAAPDAAIESVRMRYARGEIDRDEFVRVSTDLGASPPAPAI